MSDYTPTTADACECPCGTCVETIGYDPETPCPTCPVHGISDE